jgi:hypothetical protein
MAAGVLFAAILFYIYNPAYTNYFPKCPFLTLTGFYCPGCGSQRALHQILHGNLLSAMKFNVLLVLSIPFLIYHQMVKLNRYFGSFAGKINSIFYSSNFTYVVLIVVILFWLCRNIPVEPFSYLAPK